MKNSGCCGATAVGYSSFFSESPCTPVSKSTGRFNYRFGVTRLILAAEVAGLPWLSTVTVIRLYSVYRASTAVVVVKDTFSLFSGGGDGAHTAQRNYNQIITII